MPVYICDICDREFEFKFEIVVHLTNHRSVKKINKNQANAGKYYKLIHNVVEYSPKWLCVVNCIKEIYKNVASAIL